jgi:spore maturation protein CgeB
MKLVVLGLSLSSSWGNGHATTYRGLLRAFARRGHRILFLECDQPWYRDHRDLSRPDFCELDFYTDFSDLKHRFVREVAEADAVIMGSYVPQGRQIGRWLTRQAGGATAFYDIDTPITLASLRHDACEYLERDSVGEFDLYLSFTGGPALELLRERYGARRVEALYCSADPEIYFPEGASLRWKLGYLGTYSADRQPTLDRLLLHVARDIPKSRFVVAGPQYPAEIKWPENVRHIQHLAPADHRAFYAAQRFTLNVTRAEMIRLGYSPSVRLFEAAACGVPIITDSWLGLSKFFQPEVEILIAESAADVRGYLHDLSEPARQKIGRLARAKIQESHTPDHRARLLEKLLLEASGTARIFEISHRKEELTT